MELMTILNLFGNFGIDLLLVLCIIVLTQVAKTVIPIKTPKMVLLFILGLGLIFGIAHIFLAKIALSLWIRTILGYPCTSICVYVLTKKYFIEKKK